MYKEQPADRWWERPPSLRLRADQGRGLGHRGGPARRSHLRALYLLVNAGKLARIQPDAAALGTLVYLDLLRIGEPLPVENLFGAARTNPGFSQLHAANRNLPDGVERGGGAGAHSLQFRRVKPNAATAAQADIQGHVARALFAERTFASRTFHKAWMLTICTGPREVYFVSVKTYSCCASRKLRARRP